MIKIKAPFEDRRCNCCFGKNDVKEIFFERTVVAVCAYCRKDLFELLKSTDNEQPIRIEGEEHEIIKRTVSSDADCADCICRVCAASALNDSENSSVEKVCYPCDNCEYGSDLYETEEDCPDFASEE